MINVNEFQEMLNENGLSIVSAESIFSTLKKKTITIERAEKYIRGYTNLFDGLSHVRKHIKPNNIFGEYTSLDALMLFLDFNLRSLYEKYNQYGLSLPFENYAKAIEWLKDESLNGVLNTKRIPKPNINDTVIDIRSYYKYASLYLEYEDSYHVVCDSSPFLIELKGITDSLSVYTGFKVSDILKYFFCNIKPVLHRCLLSSTDYVNNVFTIQINTSDFTQDEFLELYDEYQECIGVKNKNKMSDKLKAFSIFIESKDIPINPKRQDFLSLLDEWNKIYPEWKVTTWQAMRKKYISLQEKKTELSPFLKFLIDENK